MAKVKTEHQRLTETAEFTRNLNEEEFRKHLEEIFNEGREAGEEKAEE